MAASPYSLDGMRAEFNRLSAARDTILAKSAPLRAERDKILSEADLRAKKIAAEYLRIEKDLFEIDRVRNMLARAISGGRAVAKTGA